jgi:hypothetical protein
VYTGTAVVGADPVADTVASLVQLGDCRRVLEALGHSCLAAAAAARNDVEAAQDSNSVYGSALLNQALRDSRVGVKGAGAGKRDHGRWASVVRLRVSCV